ncbi:hypothetical protein B0H11DRAFT_2238749 [Mycena galericulata]|nr:hypothetical protein B0H11DRAFT_2238749 [Mycena galericulata]
MPEPGSRVGQNLRPDPEPYLSPARVGPGGGARQVPLVQDELPPRVDRQEIEPAPVNASDYQEIPPADKPTGKKRDSAKRERYLELTQLAVDALSLDDLADVLRTTVATMRLYSSSAPTKPCFDLLDEILTRLSNHHEFPSAGDSPASFSSVVSRSVVSPVKALTDKVEAQHHAIQALSKSVENLKNAPMLSPSTSTTPSYAYVAATLPQPKPKLPPLPNPSDERILVRFDGPTPRIVS